MAKRVVNREIETTWSRFLRKYPTEEHCIRALYALMADQLICASCNTHLRLIPDSVVVQCSKCSRRQSLTAKTFFHGMRSLRLWFAAIYFLDNGTEITANRLARLMSVSTNTTRNVFLKLRAFTSSKGRSIRQPIQFYLNPALQDDDMRDEEMPDEEINEEEMQNAPSTEATPAILNFAPDLESKQALVLAALRKIDAAEMNADKHFDLLYDRTGLDVGELSACIVMLQLNGILKP
jgi:hypothetical protein